MARWFLTALVLALLPLVAVISHPELRLVLQEDVTFLWRGDVDITYPSFGSAERRALLEAQHIQGEDTSWKRLHALAQLARRTGKLYLYAEALRHACVAPLRHPKTAPESRTPPGYAQTIRKMAQEALSLSEEMIRKDPLNAFPYLVKTGALFALQKPNEAVGTFLRAARCPRYEEYVGEILAVLAPRDLPAESRSLHFMAVLFPHLSCFRESARYIRHLADEAETRGDHARALQLGEAIATAGTKMRDTHSALITSLTGIHLQEIAWQRPSLPFPQNATRSSPITNEAAQFAAYARRYGRNDLAAAALRESVHSQNLNQQIRNYIRQIADVIAVPWMNPTAKVLSLRTAATVLLLWSLAMALCVLATLPVIGMWRRSDIWQDYLAPVTATLVVGGAFIAVAVAAFLQLVGFAALRQEWVKEALTLHERVHLFAPNDLPAVFRLSTIAVLLVLALVCVALPFVRTTRETGYSWMLWCVVLGVVLGLSVASSGSLYPLSFIPAYSVVTGLLSGVAVLAGVAGLLALPFYAFLLRKPLPLLWRMGIALLWGTASFYMWQGYLVETALWLLAGVLLWALWGRGLPGAAQMEVQHALYRFGMSALILAVLGLWLYAILGYASLPARAAQHAYIDQIITQGEVSLLEAK